MSYELTVAAERDIEDILTTTLKSFGPIQLDAYAGIIEKGLEMVGADPTRPSPGRATDRHSRQA